MASNPILVVPGDDLMRFIHTRMASADCEREIVSLKHYVEPDYWVGAAYCLASTRVYLRPASNSLDGVSWE